MNDLTQYLPHLLSASGAGLQWFRAQAKFPEWGYHLLAAVACLGAWFLTHPLTLDRASIIQIIVWLPAGMASVWGGTFLVSNMAKMASPESAVANPMIPLTNSK